MMEGPPPMLQEGTINCCINITHTRVNTSSRVNCQKLAGTIIFWLSTFFLGIIGSLPHPRGKRLCDTPHV